MRGIFQLADVHASYIHRLLTRLATKAGEKSRFTAGVEAAQAGRPAPLYRFSE
jgi:hypothetical protein